MTQQASLFPEDLPDPRRNQVGKMHSGAGATEQAGAVLVFPRSGTLRFKVLEHVAKMGWIGATHWDVTEHSFSPAQHTSVGARLKELEEDHWIEKKTSPNGTPMTRLQRQTGKHGYVYVLTEQGRKEFGTHTRVP
jgi:hypothetical protein